MNCLKMNSANLVKGGVVVVLMLAALAAFDSFGSSGYVGSPITGAQTAVKATCPASITVSTGGFTNYKQGETITFIIKVLDAEGNILKTRDNVGLVAPFGDFGNDEVLFTHSASSTVLNSAATASGEIRYQLPLGADIFERTRLTTAKIWIRPWAYSIRSTATSGCKEVTSDKNFYVYVHKTEPDLAVEEIGKSPVVGGDYKSSNFYYTIIANHGATLSSSFDVVAMIRIPGSTTQVYGTTLKSGLGADAKQTFKFSLKPEDLSCGNNTLEVAVDPDGAVATDTYRNNNVKSIIVKKDCTSSGSEGASGGSGTAAGGTGQQAAQPAQQAANYKKTLYAGWNLVGLDALSNVVSSTCGYPPQIWKSIYEFNPEKQDYDPPRTLEIGLNGEIKLTGDVDQTRVAWVYKYEQPAESCEIQSYIASMASTGSAVQAAQPRRAALDWNLVTVPQDWIGKTPRQAFTNSCEFSKAYYFDTGIQDYREWFVSSTNAFSSQDVGKAFWLYATQCWS